MRIALRAFIFCTAIAFLAGCGGVKATAPLAGTVVVQQNNSSPAPSQMTLKFSGASSQTGPLSVSVGSGCTLTITASDTLYPQAVFSFSPQAAMATTLANGIAATFDGPGTKQISAYEFINNTQISQATITVNVTALNACLDCGIQLFVPTGTVSYWTNENIPWKIFNVNNQADALTIININPGDPTAQTAPLQYSTPGSKQLTVSAYSASTGLSCSAQTQLLIDAGTPQPY